MGRYYGDDLAYVHDVGFGGFSTGAAPGLLQILHRGEILSGLVVDLGCGTGLWARELVDAGYDVLGIDISAAMVAMARKKVPSAKFLEGSFLESRLPQCDAVTSIGECFCYLFDEKAGLQGLSLIFRRVFRALRPGGLFIFDVLEPPASRTCGSTKTFSDGSDWACHVQRQVDGSRETLTRQITTFRRVGRLYRRSDENHHQKLWNWCQDTNSPISSIYVTLAEP